MGAPISKSRAAYWLGRAYEADKKPDQALAWYDRAAQHGHTYYGQLAAKKLPGGTGLAFDWSLLTSFQHTMPWGLAGGLTPETVAEAIRKTGAELVDASSGLETAPGIKDAAKITAFCEAARAA